VVLNSADAASAQWDYAIRVNYTQNFEMGQANVGQ
jgi:hypothetical protein